MENILKKEMIYKTDKMEAVNVRSNLSYRKQDPLARMDLYEAVGNDKNTKRPVVILVHGEAKDIQQMKNVGQYRSWGRVIASLGIHAIAFDHRMVSDGHSIQSVMDDITELINYTQLHADELGIDTNKMMIMSFSGGVPFGMYVGMSDLFKGIKGLIAYYGIGDFDLVNELLGASHTDEQAKTYAIKQLIEKRNKEIPPLFIVRSGLDDKRLNASMDETILKILSYNLSLELYNHETGHHAFDLFDDNKRSHDIIKQSIYFIQRILLDVSKEA